MIAGVVITLNGDASKRDATLNEIASRPELALGEFQPADQRIPLTIDAAQRSGVEELTDWIRSRAGVAFVDVVCVHFEESDDEALPAQAADSAVTHFPSKERPHERAEVDSNRAT